MGTDHSFRYVKIPEKPAMQRTDRLYYYSEPTVSHGQKTITFESNRSMRDYQFLEFYYYYSTYNNDLGNQLASLFLRPTDLMTYPDGNGVPTYYMCLVTTDGLLFRRRIYYVSDTSVKFSTCSSTNGIDNKYVIPYMIYGWK